MIQIEKVHLIRVVSRDGKVLGYRTVTDANYGHFSSLPNDQVTSYLNTQADKVRGRLGSLIGSLELFGVTSLELFDYIHEEIDEFTMS